MVIFLLMLFSIILLCGRLCLYNGRRFMPANFTYFYGLSILYLITCCRYMVGFDYPAYYDIFLSGGADYFEPVPKFFYYVALYFENPGILFFLFGFFTLTFVLFGIHENSSNKYESLVIFITVFYLESLNVIRQWLAVALMFYAFKYVVNKNIFKYLLYVCVAFFMHSSAIICLPIYFVFNYIPFCLTVFCSVICLFFSEQILSLIFSFSFLGLAKYSGYLKFFVNAGSQKVVYFFYLLFILSFLIYLFSGKDRKLANFIKLAAIGLLFPKVIGAQLGIRMALYYNCFYIISLPLFFAKIKLVYIKRNVFLIPFYFYYFLYLIIDYINTKAFSPYKFYFIQEIIGELK